MRVHCSEHIPSVSHAEINKKNGLLSNYKRLISSFPLPPSLACYTWEETLQLLLGNIWACCLLAVSFQNNSAVLSCPSDWGQRFGLHNAPCQASLCQGQVWFWRFINRPREASNQMVPYCPTRGSSSVFRREMPKFLKIKCFPRIVHVGWLPERSKWKNEFQQTKTCCPLKQGFNRLGLGFCFFKSCKASAAVTEIIQFGEIMATVAHFLFFFNCTVITYVCILGLNVLVRWTRLNSRHVISFILFPPFILSTGSSTYSRCPKQG